MICSFLKNKTFAIYLGVTGLGIISQLTNLITLLNYFVPLGIPNGLSKFIAEENILEKERLKKIFLSSLSLVFFPVVFFSVIFFLFSGLISEFLFESIEYESYIKIISVFLPFIAFSSMLEGFIRGLKVINLYVKLIIISNIINLIIIIPLVLLYGIKGAIIGILTSNVIYITFSIYYLTKNKIIDKFEIIKEFDKELFYKIIKVSFVFLISGAFFQLSLLMLRKMIISDLGMYYNGIFQSVIGISISYFGFIFLSLSTYSFPTISKMSDIDDINSELNINVKYIMLLMVPLVILVFSFRYLVISVLFSKDFFPSESLFVYQFLGDYFKALAWAIGIWLVPKMKLKVFVLLEIILNFNLIFIFYIILLSGQNNILYVSVTYLIAYFIHFILNYVFSKKLINFGFTKENRKLFFISIVVLISAMLISQLSYMAGMIASLPVLALWFYLSIKKEEMLEIKKIFLSVIRKYT